MLIATTGEYIVLWISQFMESKIHPVCGYIAVFEFSQIVPGENVFASNIAEWGTALFSLSLATNIIVTSLIGKLQVQT